MGAVILSRPQNACVHHEGHVVFASDFVLPLRGTEGSDGCMVIGYGWDDKEEIEVGMNKEKIHVRYDE
jgi:hypothetical protein